MSSMSEVIQPAQKVLIVMGHPGLQARVKRLLKQSMVNPSVWVASTYELGLNLARAQHFHAIVCGTFLQDEVSGDKLINDLYFASKEDNDQYPDSNTLLCYLFGTIDPETKEKFDEGQIWCNSSSDNFDALIRVLVERARLNMHPNVTRALVRENPLIRRVQQGA